MYHWESCDIQGNFEQIAGKWWVNVGCGRYGIDPDMLEGRCITIKGQRKRLGKLGNFMREGCSYFLPWQIPDFTPPDWLEKRMRGLYLVTDGTKREKEITCIRQSLKDCAMRSRIYRATDDNAPGVEGWQRWALEPLDELLCCQAAMDWPLPPNQFSKAGEVDFYEVFNMFNDINTRGKL